MLPTSAHPEPVEGPSFFFRKPEEGKGFDKLSPNGSEDMWNALNGLVGYPNRGFGDD